MHRLIPALLAVMLVPEVAADSLLRLEGAWVRALPPTQPNTAAYLTVNNPGRESRQIVGASSPVAGRVEIHTTREVDGLMRMRRLEKLDLAPGQAVPLAPGGTHLMLLDLARMPAPGEEVQLCLQLATGEEVCTVALARKTGPEQGGGNHEHKHH